MFLKPIDVCKLTDQMNMAGNSRLNIFKASNALVKPWNQILSAPGSVGRQKLEFKFKTCYTFVEAGFAVVV